jgi:AraC-like DNA-binding protein
MTNECTTSASGTGAYGGGAYGAGAYGRQMASALPPGIVKTLIASPSAREPIAITRLESRAALPVRTVRVRAERAFVVQVQLSPAPVTGRDEGSVATDRVSAGSTTVYDLESDPMLAIGPRLDCVQYYLSRATLDAFTDDSEIPRVVRLQSPPQLVHPILQQMSAMIAPVVKAEDRSCELVLDHFRLMVCAYVVKHCGDVPSTEHVFRGGLASWQRRRVRELLHANLDGHLGLSALASECGLSVSHFARSFRRSFGTTVHRYLTERRIERAKQLMTESRSSLSQIALEAGFGDQPAFSRTFRALVGTTPRQWRTDSVHAGRPARVRCT